MANPAVLKISITGIGGNISWGNAEPKNYYHLGMIRWGTANGVFPAYPITSDTELVILPANMNILYYEFAAGVTATIVEQSTV
jgi:hypothetical protein